jgi:D-alanyl-D-alanine carboxypeptidase
MLSVVLAVALAADASVPPDALTSQLAAIGARHGLPALAAYASKGDKVQQAAWGVRKLGDVTPVGLHDRWHLGSDTKALTATLAALLVEEGKLAWNTTVATALADWGDLDPAFATITLEMLLTHRAGLAHDVQPDLWKKMWKPKSPDGQRQNVVHTFLQRAPSEKVGEFSYSNAGYMVVGVMLEKLGGDTWEAQLRQRVFAPLGMSSCGFGAPATLDTVDAPWGHRLTDGKLEAVPPGRGSDNPPSFGPAGTVHCSLEDWHKLVKMHVRGERGLPTRLKLSQATFEKLHTAVGTYAMGWGVTAHPRWPTARALAHDGSNTMFYATVLAIPAEGLVILAATNRGDDEATAAVNEVVEQLTGQMARE